MYLFPVFFVLNGIHSAAGFGVKHEVKASVFTETTGVAQEGVFFIIINRPRNTFISLKNLDYTVVFSELHYNSSCSPALVALIHVLSTVAADPGVGRDRRAAARALQGLCGRLVVLVEV